jgi:N-acetylmuramoyl-L-alanine amidase
MPKRHVVALGDSIESIAYSHGFFWKTLWDAPENAALREQRANDPNALLPGDVVHVPDLRGKSVARAAGAHHVFRRKGVPSVLKVRLLEDARPRANIAYTVEAAGRNVTGTTDADGWVECYLMPDVEEGILRLDATDEELAFTIGTKRPATTTWGIQTRLRNLGFYGGPIDGEPSDATTAALRAFQRAALLPVTGEPDKATIAAFDTFGG